MYSAVSRRAHHIPLYRFQAKTVSWNLLQPVAVGKRGSFTWTQSSSILSARPFFQRFVSAQSISSSPGDGAVRFFVRSRRQSRAAERQGCLRFCFHSPVSAASGSPVLHETRVASAPVTGFRHTGAFCPLLHTQQLPGRHCRADEPQSVLGTGKVFSLEVDAGIKATDARQAPESPPISAVRRSVALLGCHLRFFVLVSWSPHTHISVQSECDHIIPPNCRFCLRCRPAAEAPVC
jgi:hypothetical protein